MPAFTRQVVFSAPGSITLTETPLPPTNSGDILVRIRLVGICATDLHLLAGHIGDPFPLVPGHEFVGEVASIGSDAAARRGISVGDHVAVEMLLPCNSCARCREGRYNLCEADDSSRGLSRGRQYGVNIPATVEPGLWGGYAEYLHVPPEAIVHPLPPSLPWDTAVLVEPLAVACRAIARARLRLGESVVIIGPGPVGLLAVAAARAAGAGRIIVAGTRASRLELAKRFGADATVDTQTADLLTATRDELNGLADVVIETAGVAAAQEQAVRIARRGGRVVLAGACGSGVPVTFRQDEELLLKEIDLLPSFLSAGGFEPAIALLSQGGFPFRDLVTHRFGLDEVSHAYEVLAARTDNVLKAVIDLTASAA